MAERDLMRNLDLEEQEQLAQFKAWWHRYGNLLVTAATVALVIVAGVNGWRWYQRSQAADASMLFQTIQKAAADRDGKKLQVATDTMLKDFGGTTNAPLAALLAAKVHFDEGDAKSARARLQWVIDHASDPELKSVARLRLAHVLVDDNAAEEAVKLLEAPAEGGFQAMFAALRGDILVLLDKRAEARAAYRSALEKIDAKSGAQRERIQLKLEALGEG